MIDSGTTYTYIISSEYKVLPSALVVEINNVMSQHHVQFPIVTRPRVSSHSLYLIFLAFEPSLLWSVLYLLFM